MACTHFIIAVSTVFLLLIELSPGAHEVGPMSRQNSQDIRLQEISGGIFKLGDNVDNIANILQESLKKDVPSKPNEKPTCSNLCPADKARLGKIEEKIKHMGKKKYPASCAEVQERGFKKNGVYKILPHSYLIKKPVSAYCDLTTQGGGWTVFQKRDNNGNRNNYFLRKWKDYEQGFGDPKKDYWLGNKYLYALTNQEEVVMRFDLWDWSKNHRYASTNSFRITEPKTYTMFWSGYRGNAGNSLPGSGYRFSTIDGDHDTCPTCNCAISFTGAWWYGRCHSSNLNGLYKNKSYGKGVLWNSWKGYYYPLKKTEIKLRPKNFRN